MTKSDSIAVLPWAWELTAASALLAAVTYHVSVPLLGGFTAELAGVAGVGVLYLLYAWGQDREQPRRDGGDEEERRKKRKMKARAQEWAGGGG
jgi:hypothetical protein